MIKFMILTFFSLVSASALSQEFSPSQPRWYTGPECGVAAYQRSIRSECGVKSYIRTFSPACPIEAYNAGRDMSCPGSKQGGEIIQVIAYKEADGTISLTGSGLDTAVQGGESLRDVLSKAENLDASVERQTNFNFWSCFGTRNSTTDDFGRFSFSAYSLACSSRDFAAECRNPSFGVASYASCEHPSHGVAQYNECDDLGVVAAYKTCLIRKNMPEIEAYIEATQRDIQLLGRQLARAESEYLLNSNQIKLASCLIDRYIDETIYDDILEDLKNNFAVMFGESYRKNLFECSSVTEKVRYTLNGSSCEDFSDREISDKINTETLKPNDQRFWKVCEAESAAKSLRNWFEFHEYEIGQLLGDVVAKGNESVRTDLSELKDRISTAYKSKFDCPQCKVKNIELAD